MTLLIDLFSRGKKSPAILHFTAHGNTLSPTTLSSRGGGGGGGAGRNGGGLAVPEHSAGAGVSVNGVFSR